MLEIASLLTKLGEAQLPPNYDHNARRADFLAVFMQSDQGQRVLGQIISMCEGPPLMPPSEGEDGMRRAMYNEFRNGQRFVIGQITRALAEMNQPVVEE